MSLRSRLKDLGLDLVAGVESGAAAGDDGVAFMQAGDDFGTFGVFETELHGDDANGAGRVDDIDAGGGADAFDGLKRGGENVLAGFELEGDFGVHAGQNDTRGI